MKATNIFFSAKLLLQPPTTKLYQSTWLLQLYNVLFVFLILGNTGKQKIHSKKEKPLLRSRNVIRSRVSYRERPRVLKYVLLPYTHFLHFGALHKYARGKMILNYVMDLLALQHWVNENARVFLTSLKVRIRLQIAHGCFPICSNCTTTLNKSSTIHVSSSPVDQLGLQRLILKPMAKTCNALSWVCLQVR